MTSFKLLLFIHLLKREWKNGRVKQNIFWKSFWYFHFGQDGCRKSNFAKPNSSQIALKFLRLAYLITILRDISAIVITKFQGETQEPWNIYKKRFETRVNVF